MVNHDHSDFESDLRVSFLKIPLLLQRFPFSTGCPLYECDSMEIEKGLRRVQDIMLLDSSLETLMNT